MASCTFFGNRDTPEMVTDALWRVLKRLVVQEGVDCFYVGNQGAFDDMVIHTLCRLKQRYPHIACKVVLPYLPSSGAIPRSAAAKMGRRQKTPYVWEQSRAYYPGTPPETICPQEVQQAPPRCAILRRNRWMLQQADMVVAFVASPLDDAADYCSRARAQGKPVINLFESKVYHRV